MATTREGVFFLVMMWVGVLGKATSFETVMLKFVRGDNVDGWTQLQRFHHQSGLALCA